MVRSASWRVSNHETGLSFETPRSLSSGRASRTRTRRRVPLGISSCRPRTKDRWLKWIGRPKKSVSRADEMYGPKLPMTVDGSLRFRTIHCLQFTCPHYRYPVLYRRAIRMGRWQSRREPSQAWRGFCGCHCRPRRCEPPGRNRRAVRVRRGSNSSRRNGSERRSIRDRHTARRRDLQNHIGPKGHTT